MASSNPRVLILGAGNDAAAFEAALGEHAEILGVDPQLAMGMSVARALRPDLCFVFYDDDPTGALELVRLLNQESISVPIVVSVNQDPDNILRAMRVGARDFAFYDRTRSTPAVAAADLLRAVRDWQKTRVSTRPPRASKIITVFACKGGAGASTVAVNLAYALRTSTLESGKSPDVVVVDFDTMLGDVAVMLDLKPSYGFRDVLDNMVRLDADLLRSSLPTHSSGFCVLAGAGVADPTADVSPEERDRVLTFLAQHFDYIVIDGVNDFHEHALVALDRADSILCVMTQDLPALKNANRALKLFDTLGYPQDKVKLIVNRYRSGGRLSTDSISDALRRRVDATVENDFPTVIKCIDAGTLVTEQHAGTKVGKTLAALSLLYLAPPPQKRRSLLPFWSKS